MKNCLNFILPILAISIGNSQSCLPGGLTLNSQAEVDQFIIDFPNCIEIGPLHIEGDDIINLNALHNLTIVKGDLVLERNIFLNDLSGIQSLTVIEGEFLFKDNPSIESISGFANLTVLGNLVFDSNNKLLEIGGFSNIEEIGGIGIGGNIQLNSIDAFHNVQFIDGIFGYRNDSPLEELDILNSLIAVDGTFTISSDSLIEVNGFKELISVGGQFQLQGLPNVEQIGGFMNLQSTGSHFNIEEIDKIKNLNNFNSILLIGGGLIIQENDLLKDIDIFDSIFSIGGKLEIQKNPSLESLIGLTNLIEIDGDLEIYGNTDLHSLKGIQNIEPSSIDEIEIYENPQISDCSYLPICENLSIIDEVFLHSNSTGCNTIEEILFSCIPDTTSIQVDLCPGETINLNGLSITEFGFYEQELLSCGNIDSLVQITVLEATDCGDCNLSSPNLGFQIIKHSEGVFLLRDDAESIKFNSFHELNHYVSKNVESKNLYRLAKNHIQYSPQAIMKLIDSMKVGSSLKI